ncbi:MAG: D-glucuronyl C5-epimerase family protein, partial [Actinomycetota bacterium]|nr:D-glucuronyl C5-epimerase family protein [Actinomycetota bacterium]
MGVRSLVAALLVFALAPAARAADAAWTREAHGARAALARSVHAGYLSPADESRYLGILGHARAVRDRVPPLRARLLDGVLAQVGTPKSPIAPRALELYTTLAENADYLDSNRVPADGTDVTGSDGVVYRFFAGKGLQFHPLANASQLNALVAAGDTGGARTLASALAARAMPQPDGALAWEYPFDFGRVHAPWSSGMAQAVMAQALARDGETGLARRAFLAIPGSLDRKLPSGPWIRLYSGRRDVVLNAQLQSAISIGDYAKLTNDSGAAEYASRLLTAAKTMLPRFDTGHWSRYALGVESNLHYQDYVIGLLKLLDTRTGDPVWADMVQRFELYETEPPRLTGPSVTRVVYPRPQDGVRDALVVRFWLSKIAKVALVVDGKAVDGYTWSGGWHTFRYTPLALAPGTHPVRLVARSPDGNPGETDLGSFEVARDTTPPELAAAKAGGRVFWRTKDVESACCRLRLALQRGAEHRLIT